MRHGHELVASRSRFCRDTLTGHLMLSFTATLTIHIYIAFILTLRTELLQANLICHVFYAGFTNVFLLVGFKIVNDESYVIALGNLSASFFM
jgi:ascorbate-specific PTS system EIIC-type component UlaA